MGVEIRYAVTRDYVRNPHNYPREWWTQPRARFQRDWVERTLFEHKASALAIIWQHRADDPHNSYKHTLVRVTRRSKDIPDVKHHPRDSPECVLEP